MWSAVSSAVLLLAGLAAWLHVALRVLAWPWPWAIGGAVTLYFAVVAAFVASYFALAWLWRSPRPPEARIGTRATLRLVWREYLAIVTSPFRMMFYRALVRMPRPAAGHLPVLLLHGVLCNAGVWRRTLRYLRGRHIRPVYALSYGPPLASIDGFAVQVDALVTRICAETGAPQVMIVAHSMGGLVALAYLRRFGTARVRRLVTLGTPWQGSRHAGLFFGTSLTQLRPGNAWLSELDPRAPGDELPVVSIWSWHDSMVTPQTSSILPGASNVALRGIGHNALLGERAVLARIAEEYGAAVRAGAPPAPQRATHAAASR